MLNYFFTGTPEISKKKKGIFEFYRNYKFYSVFSLTWPASIQKKAFT